MTSASSRNRRRALRELIRTNPAIALIAGSILGPPPSLQVPGSPNATPGTEPEPDDTE